jgi:hypothetical protein
LQFGAGEAAQGTWREAGQFLLLEKRWERFLFGRQQFSIHGSKGTIEASAFSNAELGEMLPARLVKGEGVTFALECWKNNTSWQVSYSWEEDTRHLAGRKIETCNADTEADARAKMLVYLLENELIRPNP